MEKIIKVQVTRTFTKTATIEVNLPPDYQLEETSDYLYDTMDQWQERVENALEKAELESDPELDISRFDVYQRVILQKKIWGGTL
jgi:hypothetical protein